MLCRTHTRRKGNSGFLPPEKKKKKTGKGSRARAVFGNGEGIRNGVKMGNYILYPLAQSSPVLAARVGWYTAVNPWDALIDIK